MQQPNNELTRGNIGAVYYAGRVVFSIMRAFFLICISFVILYPLIYMLSMAIRDAKDFYDVTVVWIPKNFTWSHFQFAISKLKLWSPMLNTIIISAGSTIGQLFVCAMTGYGFARFKFKGNGILFIFVIITIMMPTQMIQIPSYLIMMDMDFFNIIEAINGVGSGVTLIDSYLAFLLPAFLGQGMRSGLFVLIFRMFFMTMPVELEEAARIDGCGYFKTFIRVMLPNAKTSLFICGLFSLVWYWSDYYGPYMYLSGKRTLAVALMSIGGTLEKILPIDQRNNYYKIPIQNATLLFGLLPLLLVFIFTQKFFRQGLERSGIVG